MSDMQILLASPRGFCAAWIAPSTSSERAIELFGAPIYVRHEVVHNRHVVERLRALGARFVEELDEVPDGATVIFSAHGVSSTVEKEAKRRGFAGVRRHLPAGDQGAPGSRALCARCARRGADRPCGPPGGRGHHGPLRCRVRRRIHLVEMSRTRGSWRCGAPESLAFVTQTTLSVGRHPGYRRCAARALSPSAGAARRGHLLRHAEPPGRGEEAAHRVRRAGGGRVGDQLQFQRLRELADRAGIPGYLVDGPENLRREWFEGRAAVGLTAGASAPELLVQQVVEQLRAWGGQEPRQILGRAENVVFSLPKALRSTAARG